jgi:hypothetical protein
LPGQIHLTGTSGTLVGGDPWVPMFLIEEVREDGDREERSSRFKGCRSKIDMCV